MDSLLHFFYFLKWFWIAEMPHKRRIINIRTKLFKSTSFPLKNIHFLILPIAFNWLLALLQRLEICWSKHVALSISIPSSFTQFNAQESTIFLDNNGLKFIRIYNHVIYFERNQENSHPENSHLEYSHPCF